MSLTTNATGKTNSGAVDNVFEFTKCKDVRLEGNTYDDGMKLYAVLSGMQESSLINLDPEIKVTNNVNGAASNPVQDICYASTNPDVASVDAKGRITARKEGTATVFAYYHWNDTIVRSNQVEVTVGKGAAGETQKVTIQGADNIQLTQAGETHAFEALVRPSGTAVWSVEDFETGNETDIAEIDENGVLTARKNGIVWVTASAGLSVDRRAVIITLPETDGLNPAFTVKRENADARTLGKDSAVIKMQKGDLYQKDNNVNNLFLYQVPESIAKDNLRTVIKVENLPVKEAGFWDTGSFLLYKDDDNYISVGKKSHFNGITRVVETGGSATETGGNSSENAVSTAYLGFYKNGSQVSLDFKLEGGQWQNVATVSDTTIGNDYQIGFATWGEASRNKELTYSDFHVASGDVSYEELCEQTPIVFTGMPNQAPTVSDAAFGAETYRVGDTAEVSYQYTDPEGDQEGRTLYCFSYGGTQEVTTEPRTVLKATGTITCTVYPVDVNGTPGVPVSAEAQVEAGEGPVELQELQFNSTILYQSGDSERDFEVKVPSELTMAQISYKMPGDGQNVRILVDGKPLQDSYPGNASVTLPIADGTSIQVKPSESSVYTIKISVVEDCTADAKRIAIPGLDFEESQPTEKSWFINTDRKEAELEVELNDQVGSLRVLRNDNREELEISREGGLYKIPMVFKTGINSFYIQVTAKDGITMNQYLIVANYDAPSDAAPEMIQVDGVDVEGFAADQKEYLVQVKEDAAEKGVKVSQGTAKRIQIIVNGVMTEGNQAEVTEWKQGMNEVSVIAWAADGIVKNIYQIHAFLPMRVSMISKLDRGVFWISLREHMQRWMLSAIQ